MEILESKSLKTQQAVWKFERVRTVQTMRDDQAGLAVVRWVVSWWKVDAKLGVTAFGEWVELGRWHTWKAAVEGMMAQEERWHKGGLQRQLEEAGLSEGIWSPSEGGKGGRNG